MAVGVTNPQNETQNRPAKNLVKLFSVPLCLLHIVLFPVTNSPINPICGNPKGHASRTKSSPKLR